MKRLVARVSQLPLLLLFYCTVTARTGAETARVFSASKYSTDGLRIHCHLFYPVCRQLSASVSTCVVHLGMFVSFCFILYQDS